MVEVVGADGPVDLDLLRRRHFRLLFALLFLFAAGPRGLEVLFLVEDAADGDAGDGVEAVDLVQPGLFAVDLAEDLVGRGGWGEGVVGAGDADEVRLDVFVEGEFWVAGAFFGAGALEGEEFGVGLTIF